MKNRIAFASILAAAALAAAANAEFAVGDTVLIQGVAGPEGGYTYWGWNTANVPHSLGTSNQIYLDTTNPNNFVSVTSWITNAGSTVNFSFDFSHYLPGNFTLHALEIDGLKPDGSPISVTASQGTAHIGAANKVRWDGSGASLAQDPKLLLSVTNVPAPGALALIGAAGIIGARRRRA